MNITKKIIISDTNIITDLYIAGLALIFVLLDNVYVSDMIINDELNYKTCDYNIINNIKPIKSTINDIHKMIEIAKIYPKLSIYDCMNYVLSKKHNAILATGDHRLRKLSLENGVEVIRTLKIIELLYENNIISEEEVFTSCNKLMENTKVRIPKKDIELFMTNIKNKKVLNVK